MTDHSEGSPDLSAAEVLAALRHDLSTPLNQIIGYSELLEEEASESSVSFLPDLQRIQAAAHHLHHLLRTRLQPSEVLTGLVASGVQDSPVRSWTPSAVEESAAVAPSVSQASRLGKVLLVDDEPLNRDLLAARLQREGHQVVEAVDGLHALEQLRLHKVDLVLLDVMMPRLNGHETLLSLKADDELRHIPVIMISALDDLGSVVKSIEAGAEDYLPKPFNSTLLRARIGACLEKKSLRDHEIGLYRSLKSSRERLERELQSATAYVASLNQATRDDPRVVPLLAAFQRMTTALSRQETELRATIRELEIQINASALSQQVSSIVADPTFQALAERARAMRRRRQH